MKVEIGYTNENDIEVKLAMDENEFWGLWAIVTGKKEDPEEPDLRKGVVNQINTAVGSLCGIIDAILKNEKPEATGE